MDRLKNAFSEAKEYVHEVHNNMRARGQGIDEGVNSFIGGTLDGISYLIGLGANKLGLDVDQKKGVLSGSFFKTRLDERSRQFNGYDPAKETPGMKEIREGVSGKTEATLMVAAIAFPMAGAGPLVTKGVGAVGVGAKKAVAAGIAIDVAEATGQTVHGYNEEKAKIAAEKAATVVSAAPTMAVP